MNARIHTKVITAIAAAAMIAAAATPCASADPAKGMRIQIPPVLSHLQEPGSTGWVPRSSSTPRVDPLAVGYLMGQGLSPSEVTSWTTGACSQRVKAASCYAMFRAGAASKPVDPLAVGYLIGQGLAPSEVRAWTTGICSRRIKDAACYAMLQPAVTGSIQTTGSTSFHWSDAGVGAGVALGLALSGAGALMALRKRRTLAHV
jgi:hypothetical protein